MKLEEVAYPLTSTSQDEVLIAFDIKEINLGLFKGKQYDASIVKFRDDIILASKTWTSDNKKDFHELYTYMLENRVIVHGLKTNKTLVEFASLFKHNQILCDTQQTYAELLPGTKTPITLDLLNKMFQNQIDISRSSALSALLIRNVFLSLNSVVSGLNIVSSNPIAMILPEYAKVASLQIDKYYNVPAVYNALTAIAGPMAFHEGKLAYGIS